MMLRFKQSLKRSMTWWLQNRVSGEELDSVFRYEVRGRFGLNRPPSFRACEVSFSSRSFPSPHRSVTIKDYQLSFHGAEGVGSDCFTDVSLTRGRPAGHAVHSLGRQGTRSSTFGHEVKATLWRSAGAADLRPSVLRRSRTAGVGAARFLRSFGIAAGI